MTEQLLHGADVVAVLDQRRREAVSKDVRRHPFRDARPSPRIPHVALDRRLEHMMPPDPPRPRTRRKPIRRKHPLPARLEPRPRILPRERPRQIHLAVPFRQILRVQRERDRDLLPKRLHRPLRQHRQPIPPPLPIPDPQLPPLEIDVLNPQPQRLEQPQPAAPQQQRHDPRIPLEPRQHALHFFDRQHHGNPNRPPRPHHLPERPELPSDHIPIEEEQRIQRLILRPRRHVPPRRQLRQKRLDLLPPHPRRMPLAMKQDELLHPRHITPLRRQRPVSNPKLIPKRIQHPWRPIPPQRRARPEPERLRLPRLPHLRPRPHRRSLRTKPRPSALPSRLKPLVAARPPPAARPGFPRTRPGSP
jgi:hypothetical protein